MSAAPQHRPDHARELRYVLVDAMELCSRLGLIGGKGSWKRNAGGVLIRCPSHDENSPSCSVRRGPDGTLAVICFGCGFTGDALTLIAAVNKLDLKSDFRSVLRVAAEISGQWQIVDELDRRDRAAGTERPAPRPRAPIPPPPPEPERTYPDSKSVDRLWNEAIAPHEDAEAAAWCTKRGLDAELLAEDELSRVISVANWLPSWARYRGDAAAASTWVQSGHRLIVPMFDRLGERRSVRATRIADGNGHDAPKRLPPSGMKATDLVMACPIALAMLRGTAKPSELVIVEGEPDFLTWATRRTQVVTGRIGIVNGSWSFEFAKRVPPGTKVWIRTDHDQAGNRYAEELTKTLRWAKSFPFRGGRRD
jgi:hypothetical protein